MSPRRVLLGLAAIGVLCGTAVPALADDVSTRVCVNTNHDRNGSAPLCVWIPGDLAGQP